MVSEHDHEVDVEDEQYCDRKQPSDGSFLFDARNPSFAGLETRQLPTVDSTQLEGGALQNETSIGE